MPYHHHHHEINYRMSVHVHTHMQTQLNDMSAPLSLLCHTQIKYLTSV